MRICWIASRVFTMGMGQKRPMQSISLSGMSTFDSAAMPRYGILALVAASRRRGDGERLPVAPAGTF